MINEATAELSKLSTSQLKLISEDPDAYALFLKGTETWKDIHKEEEVIETELAELENCRKEVSIIQETLQAKLMELKTSARNKHETLTRLSRVYIDDAMKDNVAELEAASEKILTEFTSSKLPPEEFLSKFVQQRKQFHTNNHKYKDRDRLAKQLIGAIQSE
eukprot:TRINITY_DN7861_c1_g1_i1.p1 TRINITY_DN7861_c1_g1~~TRINITY_DN7861_c1_g1_i1.p1  ORF type:complete len:175 (+),score=44.09 TRINITY_DN7861_c1_g1_i1:40-525(+)